VRHPQYGLGEVKSIAESTASVLFGEGPRTVSPEPAGGTRRTHDVRFRVGNALDQFLKNTVAAVLDRLGYENPNSVADQLGTRWHKGKTGAASADPSLQPRKCPSRFSFINSSVFAIN